MNNLITIYTYVVQCLHKFDRILTKRHKYPVLNLTGHTRSQEIDRLQARDICRRI